MPVPYIIIYSSIPHFDSPMDSEWGIFMAAERNRKKNRLEDYDYSQGGYYFVTICTNGGVKQFGEIRDDKMILSPIGEIVDQCWQAIPEHFPNVKLDEYVIMPNHVHGIVIIENNNENVGNRHACSLQDRRQYQKLPVIVGSFKSSATRKINKQSNKTNFVWQKSFYDHIIRNERSFNQIRQYIRNNPAQWALDRNNPVNLPLNP